MEFIDIIFIVGLFLMSIGAFSAVALLRLSILKSKEELKDLMLPSLDAVFDMPADRIGSNVFLVLKRHIFARQNKGARQVPTVNDALECSPFFCSLDDALRDRFRYRLWTIEREASYLVEHGALPKSKSQPITRVISQAYFKHAELQLVGPNIWPSLGHLHGNTLCRYYSFLPFLSRMASAPCGPCHISPSE